MTPCPRDLEITAFVSSIRCACGLPCEALDKCAFNLRGAPFVNRAALRSWGCWASVRGLLETGGLEDGSSAVLWRRGMGGNAG
jgi:hypothetical protein